MSVLLLQQENRLTSFIESGLRAEGFHTNRIDSPQSAPARVKGDTHNLIVIDADSVPESAPSICSILRRSGVDVPILIISRSDNPDDIIHALRAGADDYVSVPFMFDVFLARAEALMRRVQVATPSNESRVGDLVIDKSRHKVIRGDHRIKLTPHEYRLLEYLMSSPGQVFSRTRILERVWGYDRDPLTNIVEVYIRRLRTKIDELNGPKLIHTVRGFGYKIEATVN